MEEGHICKVYLFEIRSAGYVQFGRGGMRRKSNRYSVICYSKSVHFRGGLNMLLNLVNVSYLKDISNVFFVT